MLPKVLYTLCPIMSSGSFRKSSALGMLISRSTCVFVSPLTTLSSTQVSSYKIYGVEILPGQKKIRCLPDFFHTRWLSSCSPASMFSDPLEPSVTRSTISPLYTDCMWSTVDAFLFLLGPFFGERGSFVCEKNEALVLVLGIASPVSGSASAMAAGCARRFILVRSRMTRPTRCLCRVFE